MSPASTGEAMQAQEGSADRETASRVHREAHGLEAHTLYEVSQGA
jgi:hypothetical protein